MKKKGPSRGSRDLGTALFGNTQLKVLQILFGQSERSFFASQLISLVGAGSGAVQREIARLVNSGLVTQCVIGRQRHLQANPESPIFDELRRIAIKTAGIPDVIAGVLKSLAERIDLALVYGSVAKGNASSASDVDVLVVGDDIRLEELYSAFEGAEKKLGRKINPTLFSKAEFKKRREGKNSFLTRVLEGDTTIVLGNINAAEAAR